MDDALDQLARQRNADPLTRRELGRAEARSRMDLPDRPLTGLEAVVRVRATEFRPEWGP